ncbi:uncharacterized protein [Aquarana catesbeiana]|uniref:uncharacterized protein n=1 Tax=Aquarana catesbeiana TaxID=8400 RepID=UPI003CC9D38A
MCPGEKSQRWTPMIVLFLISFPVLCHSQTALKIMDSPPYIEALLGQNVTIPCVLTDKDQPEKDLDLNLATDSVRWDMVSSNGREAKVYLFSNGRHTPYRQNSNVEGTGFKRGNASLTLYNVQQGDEGMYFCNVFVAWNKLTATRNVEVSAMPIVTLSHYEVTIALGNQQSVTCYVQKFYPESVKIRWEKRSASSEISALDRETYNSVPTKTNDGTFNVTSLMSVKPSSVQEDGDQYFCIVSHRSLKNDHSESFTVKVKEPPPTSHLPSIITFSVIIAVIILIAPLVLYFLRLSPKILDIAGIDNLIHGKSTNLSWMVSGFKPRNIEINAYLERGYQRRKIGSWKYPTPQDQNNDDVNHPERGEGIELLGQEERIQPLKPNFSFFSSNCLCSISITPDKRKDKGAELVIEVKHASLKTLLTKRQELNIKGDYFAAHITAPQYLKHGEEVTMTCDITKCDPEPLLITWLKEKQVIYKDGKRQDTKYEPTETRDVSHEGNVLKSSSSLTFRAKVKEDHRVKYTCKVTYTAIGKMLKPCHETLITAQPVVEQITCENVGQQMKLSCRVHSFHPKAIEIKWFKEKDELPTTDSKLDIDDDGLYSTSSILMYVLEMEDNGKTLRCQVDHQSLPNAEIREWKLEEQSK